MTERCATTPRRSVASRASRGKSWVLAMLATKRRLRVAPVPPKTADLTRLARGRRNNGRSGRRNRRFDRTKEQPRASGPCRHDRPSIPVVHPIVGETDQASHTEIRTTPREQIHPGRIAGDWCRSRNAQGASGRAPVPGSPDRPGATTVGGSQSRMVAVTGSVRMSAMGGQRSVMATVDRLNQSRMLQTRNG